MGKSTKSNRRRRVGMVVAAATVVLVGGAIGGGLSRVDEALGPVDDPIRSGAIPGVTGAFTGHAAERFIPCSSNILDCFSKAEFARRYGSGFGSLPGASRSRGPRSRFIPPRAPTLAQGLAGGDPALDDAIASPLAQLAEEVAPFSGGGNAGGGRAPQFDLFPPTAGNGGIGGQVPAALVAAPTPAPSNTPAIPETPIPAVPEPATWLQMLIGFAIVGSAMRWRRARRGAANFS